MRATLWGTRGSVPSSGSDTVRYGGNTSCVEVRGSDGSLLILDAGTGIRRLGAALSVEPARTDILLTHLHMDHLMGIGFFPAIYQSGCGVRIWVPPSTTLDLRSRMTRYFSAPLFPTSLRELPCQLELREVPRGTFSVGCFEVSADLVCHPGLTVGYRIAEGGATLTYLPDHEPRLGSVGFPRCPEWTSGYGLAVGADLLLHDAQYTEEEYAARIGWGHTSIMDALRFGAMAGVKRIVTFHHDPSHSDAALDVLLEHARSELETPLEVAPGEEGRSFEVIPRASGG